ncbi:LptM family lipoprotein [Methanococcoides sp. FTZ1]|uniref:LptM family lipoprotein n=1 Tax=Methanococcoides sp. FTZ1 TaxID=3439061 RepID=UPI003F8703C3
MKRMILAILIVATMLLVSGCAQNGDVPEDEIGDVVTEDMTEVPEDVAEDIDDTTADVPEDVIPEDEVSSTEHDNISSISQEDLDKLKEELEGLEFEDMGGLSEE